MTSLESILKSRDDILPTKFLFFFFLPTKVLIVKATVFPVVMYGYESWTIKKFEHQTTDALELLGLGLGLGLGSRLG